MLVAANWHDPVDVLARAVALGPLDQARDPAAVTDYRFDLTQANNRTRGPLPWFLGIPTQLLDDPTWKNYLSGRAMRCGLEWTFSGSVRMATLFFSPDSERATRVAISAA